MKGMKGYWCHRTTQIAMAAIEATSSRDGMQGIFDCTHRQYFSCRNRQLSCSVEVVGRKSMSPTPSCMRERRVHIPKVTDGGAMILVRRQSARHISIKHSQSQLMEIFILVLVHWDIGMHRFALVLTFDDNVGGGDSVMTRKHYTNASCFLVCSPNCSWQGPVLAWMEAHDVHGLQKQQCKWSDGMPISGSFTDFLRAITLLLRLGSVC